MEGNFFDGIEGRQFCRTECGYFDGKAAVEEFYPLGECAEGWEILSLLAFDELLEAGFRRSGEVAYRNSCPGCEKCVPIRIRTGEFEFSRGQRSLMRRNSDVEVRVTRARRDLVSEEKVSLMARYNARHEDGEVLSASESREILLSLNGFAPEPRSPESTPAHPGTFNMDYNISGRLVGCAVIDMGLESLSSNYFYYDLSDEVMRRSLGTFSILREIEFCKENSIPFYYLGYYIADCRKMSYKARFRPHELRLGGRWIPQPSKG